MHNPGLVFRLFSGRKFCIKENSFFRETKIFVDWKDKRPLVFGD